MNPRMERLPKFKGLPVPFFVTYRADGTPDFKVVSADRKFQCAMERLCWCCGEKLGYWIVFVGGPECAKERLFTDAPCHEECAIDACEICPFILGTVGYGSIDLKRFEGRVLALKDRVDETPPEKMMRFKTRGYDLVQYGPGGDLVFRAHAPREIVWVERKR